MRRWERFDSLWPATFVFSQEEILTEVDHLHRQPVATPPHQGPVVNSGAYSEMTIGDAAVAFIRSFGPGPPQTTRRIVDVLKQGGISSDSKNLCTTLYNTLTKRSSCENSDIVKSGKGWTLREFQHQ